MTANLTCPIRFDQQELADLQDSLVDTFDGEFQFWFHSGAWHRLTSDGLSDHVLSGASNEAELSKLLTEVAASPNKRVIFLLRDNSLGTYRIARTLADQHAAVHGALPIIGTGRLDLSQFNQSK